MSNSVDTKTDTIICDKCESNSPNAMCVICSQKTGIMKKLDNKKYIHILCALFTDLFEVTDFTSMKITSKVNLSKLDNAIKEISQNSHCFLCSNANGLILRCEEVDEGEGEREFAHLYCGLVDKIKKLNEDTDTKNLWNIEWKLTIKEENVYGTSVNKDKKKPITSKILQDVSSANCSLKNRGGSICVQCPEHRDPIEYCLCRKEMSTEFMICCDNCDTWFHGKCVGLSNKDVSFVKKWYCSFCTEWIKNLDNHLLAEADMGNGSSTIIEDLISQAKEKNWKIPIIHNHIYYRIIDLIFISVLFHRRANILLNNSCSQEILMEMIKTAQMIPFNLKSIVNLLEEKQKKCSSIQDNTTDYAKWRNDITEMLNAHLKQKEILEKKEEEEQEEEGKGKGDDHALNLKILEKKREKLINSLYAKIKCEDIRNMISRGIKLKVNVSADIDSVENEWLIPAEEFEVKFNEMKANANVTIADFEKIINTIEGGIVSTPLMFECVDILFAYRAFELQAKQFFHNLENSSQCHLSTLTEIIDTFASVQLKDENITQLFNQLNQIYSQMLTEKDKIPGSLAAEKAEKKFTFDDLEMNRNCSGLQESSYEIHSLIPACDGWMKDFSSLNKEVFEFGMKNLELCKTLCNLLTHAQENPIFRKINFEDKITKLEDIRKLIDISEKVINFITENKSLSIENRPELDKIKSMYKAFETSIAGFFKQNVVMMHSLRLFKSEIEKTDSWLEKYQSYITNKLNNCMDKLDFSLVEVLIEESKRIIANVSSEVKVLKADTDTIFKELTAKCQIAMPEEREVLANYSKFKHDVKMKYEHFGMIKASVNEYEKFLNDARRFPIKMEGIISSCEGVINDTKILQKEVKKLLDIKNKTHCVLTWEKVHHLVEKTRANKASFPEGEILLKMNEQSVENITRLKNMLSSENDLYEMISLKDNIEIHHISDERGICKELWNRKYIEFIEISTERPTYLTVSKLIEEADELDIGKNQDQPNDMEKKRVSKLKEMITSGEAYIKKISLCGTKKELNIIKQEVESLGIDLSEFIVEQEIRLTMKGALPSSGTLKPLALPNTLIGNKRKNESDIYAVTSMMTKRKHFLNEIEKEYESAMNNNGNIDTISSSSELIKKEIRHNSISTLETIINSNPIFSQEGDTYVLKLATELEEDIARTFPNLDSEYKNALKNMTKTVKELEKYKKVSILIKKEKLHIQKVAKFPFGKTYFDKLTKIEDSLNKNSKEKTEQNENPSNVNKNKNRNEDNLVNLFHEMSKSNIILPEKQSQTEDVHEKDSLQSLPNRDDVKFSPGGGRRDEIKSKGGSNLWGVKSNMSKTTQTEIKLSDQLYVPFNCEHEKKRTQLFTPIFYDPLKKPEATDLASTSEALPLSTIFQIWNGKLVLNKNELSNIFMYSTNPVVLLERISSLPSEIYISSKAKTKEVISYVEKQMTNIQKTTIYGWFEISPSDKGIIDSYKMIVEEYDKHDRSGYVNIYDMKLYVFALSVKYPKFYKKMKNEIKIYNKDVMGKLEKLMFYVIIAPKRHEVGDKSYCKNITPIPIKVNEEKQITPEIVPCHRSITRKDEKMNMSPITSEEEDNVPPPERDTNIAMTKVLTEDEKLDILLKTGDLNLLEDYVNTHFANLDQDQLISKLMSFHENSRTKLLSLIFEYQQKMNSVGVDENKMNEIGEDITMAQVVPQYPVEIKEKQSEENEKDILVQANMKVNENLLYRGFSNTSTELLIGEIKKQNATSLQQRIEEVINEEQIKRMNQLNLTSMNQINPCLSMTDMNQGFMMNHPSYNSQLRPAMGMLTVPMYTNMMGEYNPMMIPGNMNLRQYDSQYAPNLKKKQMAYNKKL